VKPHSRILGIDDAPFRFTDESVPVVGVVVRAPSYVEGVLTASVAVDGADATDVLRERILASRYREGLALVLLDGIALGGFNLVDLDVLHTAIGVPVATATRERPDLRAMVAALRSRFPDWKARAELLQRHPLWAIETGHRPLYAAAVGIGRSDLAEILARCTVRGTLPEPIRLAHLIAAAIVKGESRGRA